MTVPAESQPTPLARALTVASDEPLRVVDWGRTEYRAAWARQESLVQQRLAGESRDTLVFTEHEPVYTLGVRPGAEKHLLLDHSAATARGIAIVKTNRGGDITYHGPGQIVGYPILDLSARKDLHAYLRLLEQALINTIGALGLAASRREGKTGIWLGTRKIAAIGVGSRRWVTFHGFALNVTTALDLFDLIVPCGIPDVQMTSISRESPALPPDLDRVVRQSAVEAFERIFDRRASVTSETALLHEIEGLGPPAILPPGDRAVR